MRDEMQIEANAGIPDAVTVSLVPGKEVHTFRADVDPELISPFSPDEVRAYLGGLGIPLDAIHGLPVPEPEA